MDEHRLGNLQIDGDGKQKNLYVELVFSGRSVANWNIRKPHFQVFKSSLLPAPGSYLLYTQTNKRNVLTP